MTVALKSINLPINEFMRCYHQEDNPAVHFPDYIQSNIRINIPFPYPGQSSSDLGQPFPLCRTINVRLGATSVRNRTENFQSRNAFHRKWKRSFRSNNNSTQTFIRKVFKKWSEDALGYKPNTI